MTFNDVDVLLTPSELKRQERRLLCGALPIECCFYYTSRFVCSWVDIIFVVGILYFLDYFIS